MEIGNETFDETFDETYDGKQRGSETVVSTSDSVRQAVCPLSPAMTYVRN